MTSIWSIWDKRYYALKNEHGVQYESDGSVPGADRNGRYAVWAHTELKNHTLTRAATLKDAQKVAAEGIISGQWIEGVYDLATLDGPAPEISNGDLVLHEGEKYRVHDIGGDSDPVFLIDADIWIDGFDAAGADEVEAPIERITRLEIHPENDQRLPVLKPVSGVKIVVFFNL